MRAGLVTDFYFPWIAGPAALVRNLGNGLSVRGHEVSLLAPSPVGPAYREMDGPIALTRARSVPSPFGFGLRVSSRPLADVGRWLDATEPDVVHVHHPFPLSASAVFAANRRGIPVVATNHTIPECSLWGLRGLGPVYSVASRAFGWWLLWLLGRCDAVVTPTETAADALVALSFKRPVTAISNGVDTTRFYPREPDDSLRVRLGLDNRPIVLYTGRLDPEKQMDVWLRAGAIVRRSVDAQLVVGGRGSDQARLKAIACELRLDGNVHFIGYLHDDEYPALYNLADVYAVTSPVELQSISTLEAASSGLPIAAVRAGALPELVRDERNGYLVEPNDKSALAARIVTLLQDSEGRRSMGSESREIALRHELNRSIDAYECFLADAILSKRGDRRVERTAAEGC